GIKNFGIYLYDKKVKNTNKYPWSIPETITVKSTVIDGSCATFSDGKLSTETDKIFSSYTQKKTTVLLTGALFVGDYQLGLLITEYNPRMLIDHYFESFQGFVTAISRLSYLEKELLKTTEELYEVQEELARDDSVLDHIGDQDYLTGGLNRRGFFAKAYDLLKEEFKPGKFAVVSYIHMESLKGINDIYGHDEGDRAVKKVAKVLQDVFGDSLCGRIRGDEFAVIEITDEEGKSEAIIQEMSMQNGNLLADSPRYINHLQYAICEFSYDDNLSLREMLKETDENLQRIKGNIS
nr:GGDEF domain-containing protein [Butyrivibrio sp.]